MNAPHTLWWHLPGPRSFLTHLVASLDDARLVFYFAPRHAPLDLESAVRQFLGEKTHYVVTDVIVRVGENLVCAVARAMNVRNPVTSIEELLINRDTSRVVVRVRGADGAANVEDWVAFTTEYAQARRRVPKEQGFRLWVDVPERNVSEGDFERAPPSSVAYCYWRGRVSHSDMRAYVAALMADRPGPHKTWLYRSIVEEFAGYDRAIADELARLDGRDLLDLVNEWPRTVPPVWGAASWAAGSRDRMGGHEYVSARHLAGNVRHGGAEVGAAKKALTTMMWAAQLRELLPWIEDMRPKLIAQFETEIREAITKPDCLQLPRGREPARPFVYDDLEVGDAVYILSQHTSVTRFDGLRTAKQIRNELAHRRPASAAALESMFDAADE